MLVRRHRTTTRIVGEAWLEERPLLRAIPARVHHLYSTRLVALPSTVAPGTAQRALGEVVQLRDLSEYERAAR
jgi:hypothetical protein